MIGTAPIGEIPLASPQPPWRKIVEATAVVTAGGDVLAKGNPIAQSSPSITAGGDVAAKAVALAQSSAVITAGGDVAAKGASIIGATASFTAAGDVAPTGVVVIESRGAFTAQADATPSGGSIAQSSPVLSAGGDLAAVGLSISTAGATIIAGEVDFRVSATASEVPPLARVESPDLQPLVESHEADALESELKALFKQMFDTYVRPDERYVNVLGMPQHGPRELIESSLAADGLSIYRGADVNSGAGAYLLRAWRAQNPKRGLHLLETYLQLLWPNVWTARQQWQDIAQAYPTALHDDEAGDRFLTSRVDVELPGSVTTGGDVNAISSGLRASLPARMVLNMAIVSETNFEIGLSAHYYAGAVVASFEGTFA